MTPLGSANRAGTYVRVSTDEQAEGYSLAAQERAAEAFCAQHGWEPVVYREEGRSARSDDLATRPVFARLLDDAEAGGIQVVLVHKMDRLARNRRVAFEAFERLAKAGVGFISISENMDYSSPAGQLMLTMLVGLGQFYSDNLSFETKKGKRERKSQGLPNGLLPFGVAKGPGGIPVPDTTARPHPDLPGVVVVPFEGLTLAFELAAAGKSDREVARALTAAGHRTSGNRGANSFSKDTVRALLRNRFYLGELPDGDGGWLPGKHESLVDPALFEAAQRARAANTSRPRWTESVRTPWALSGVAVCGGCGANVNALSHATGRRRVRCAGRTQGNGCTETSCYAGVVEDQVGALLRGFLMPELERERLLAVWRHHQRRDLGVEAERARLRRRLERLREAYLEADIERGEYLSRKAAAESELAALPAERGPDEAAGTRLLGFLRDVATAWEAANAWERNKLARQLFAQVVVFDQTVVAVVPRPEYAPFFAQTNPLPVNQDGEGCTGGSDGGRSRVLEFFAPRRVAVPDLRPRRRRSLCGTGTRYAARARRLTPEQEAAIRPLAGTRSLRSLAATFGVSHETIRGLIQGHRDPRLESPGDRRDSA